MTKLKEIQILDILDELESNTKELQKRGLSADNPIKYLEFCLRDIPMTISKRHFVCYEKWRKSFIIGYKKDGKFTHVVHTAGWFERTNPALVDIKLNIDRGNQIAFIFGPYTRKEGENKYNLYSKIIKHFDQIKNYIKDDEQPSEVYEFDI